MHDNPEVHPLIVAHRGASAFAPENTLTSFRIAMDSGAEGIEFDVRLSRDGVPVVIHDKDLFRTAGRHELVSQLNAEELGAIDVSSWFHTDSQLRLVERDFDTVPTLAKTLELLRGYRGVVFVELKCKDQDVEPLTRAVCRTLRDNPIAGRVIVKSFKLSAIPLVKAFAPDVRTAGLFAPKIRTILRKERHLVKIAAELGVDELSIHKSLASKKLIRAAEKHGLPVAVWTTDNLRWIDRAMRMGVKAVITNDPAGMLARRNEIITANRSAERAASR